MKKYIILILLIKCLLSCNSDKEEYHSILIYNQSMESYKYDRNDSVVMYDKSSYFLFELFTSKIKLGDSLKTIQSYTNKNTITISVETDPYDFENDKFESNVIRWEMDKFENKNIIIYLNGNLTFNGKINNILR